MPKRTKRQKRHADVSRITRSQIRVQPSFSSSNQPEAPDTSFNYSYLSNDATKEPIKKNVISNEFISIQRDLIKIVIIAALVITIEGGIIWKLGYIG